MGKLILIDDDPIYHKISKLMIKGYSPIQDVVSSTDGKATLDYLVENQLNQDNLPDYIFVDLHMPEYDGWDFLNGYNEIYNSFKKAIKVYIVSSSISPHDISRSKAYSFVNSFIMKPLKKEFLEALMA